MKNTQKKRWLTILALVSLTLPSVALEQRAFHSVDKTKLFYGLLTNYDPVKKSVTVRMKNGRYKRFKISLLSEEDQQYVITSQGELAVNQGLRVTFKEIKEKSTRTKKGLIRTSTGSYLFRCNGFTIVQKHRLRTWSCVIVITTASGRLLPVVLSILRKWPKGS